MTKEQKDKFRAEVYAKAFTLCGDKNEAARRARYAVEVREWRETHDQTMKELAITQKEHLKH